MDRKKPNSIALVGEGGRRIVIQYRDILISLYKQKPVSGEHMYHVVKQLFPLFPWMETTLSAAICQEINSLLPELLNKRPTKYTSTPFPTLSPSAVYQCINRACGAQILVVVKPYFHSNGSWVERHSTMRKVKAKGRYTMCDCLTRGEFYNIYNDKHALSSWLRRAHTCGVQHGSNSLAAYDFETQSSVFSHITLEAAFTALEIALSNSESDIVAPIQIIAKLLRTLYEVCTAELLQSAATSVEYRSICCDREQLDLRAASLLTEIHSTALSPSDWAASHATWTYLDKVVLITIFKTLSDASLLFYINEKTGDVKLYFTDLELKPSDRVAKWAAAGNIRM